MSCKTRSARGTTTEWELNPATDGSAVRQPALPPPATSDGDQATAYDTMTEQAPFMQRTVAGGFGVSISGEAA